VILSALIFAQLGSVIFQTRAVPDTVYVGQQVTYEATTLVDDVARTRLRANPNYTPSDVAGATVYDFPFDMSRVGDATIGGTHYRRFVFRRALFPLAPGRLVIPPSTLQYTLPEVDGYFAPMRTSTVRSDSAIVVAVPLPVAGRPVGFGGAVGDLRDTLLLDTSGWRVGDPTTVTLRLTGVGNLKLLPRPELEIPWASVTNADERVSWDSTGTVVRGSKEFDWVVTPRLSGDLVFPLVRYDYFDPATRRYLAAVTPSIRIAVMAVGATPAVAPPPRDSIGDSPFPFLGRLVQRNALVVGIAAVVVVLLIFGVFYVTRSADDEAD
jgi:hypothetical protein